MRFRCRVSGLRSGFIGLAKLAPWILQMLPAFWNPDSGHDCNKMLGTEKIGASIPIHVLYNMPRSPVVNLKACIITITTIMFRLAVSGGMRLGEPDLVACPVKSVQTDRFPAWHRQVYRKA